MEAELNMSDIHPTIALFSHQAELLDISGSKAGLDDAIGNLVAWMDAVQDKLSEDDLALLCEIGGILYREGLRRRMEGAVPD